jgi:ribosomal protein S4
MINFLKKKSRIKPFFKQMIKLRENVLLRKKLLKFKRRKWNTYVFHAKRKLQKRYLKYKIKNIQGYSVTSKPNKWTGFKGKYRTILQIYKRFKLFYGLFSKSSVKKIVRKIKKKKSNNYLKLSLYRVIERRLDAVIYRSKFSYTIKSAKQHILHGNVKVNGNTITNPSFLLRTGDLIQLSRDKFYIKKEIYERSFRTVWPHPPSHLNINYKTLQIIVGTIDYKNLSSCFHFQLKPENMILDFFYH